MKSDALREERQLKNRTAAWILAGLLAATAWAAPPAEAGRRKKARRTERVVEVRYETPAVGVQSQPGGVCASQGDLDGGLGCVSVVAGPQEKFIRVEIIDTLGLPVPAWIQTETHHGLFCGETPRPLPVEPGTENLVWVWASSGVGRLCPGTATRGIVRATLTNRP